MRQLFYMVCFILITGCGGRNKSDNDFFLKVNNFDKLSEIIDSGYYVVLETTDKSIIGQIDIVKIHEGNIYIGDTRRDVLFIFDNSGHFLNKIDRKGRGAGEYISINDFDIYGSDIFILDRSGRKILEYSQAGTLINTYLLNNTYSHLNIVDDKHIYLSSECANNSGYNFILYDYQNNEYINHIDNFPLIEYYISDISPFNKTSDGRLMITREWDNTVYYLTEEFLTPAYNFHFNTKEQIPEKSIGLPAVNTLDEYQNKEVVKRIEHVYTDNDIIYITFPMFYEGLGIRPNIARVNSVTGDVKTVRLGDEIDKDYPYLISRPLHINDGWIITSSNPIAIINRTDDYSEKFFPKGILKADDNPVLFFHKLK